jgi:hypothetical protein
MGPLEVLVIECPGQKLKGEILSALTSAVDSGTLRIVDVTFVHKDSTGLVSSYELAEIEEYELAPYDIVDETRGLLSASDVHAIGQQITPDSSAILMVIEHAWTARLEQTVAAAECRIVLHERIPTDIAVAAFKKSETLRKSLKGGG